MAGLRASRMVRDLGLHGRRVEFTLKAAALMLLPYEAAPTSF